MSWINVIIEIIKIIGVLIQIWKIKGSSEAKAFMEERRKYYCDEVCQLKKLERSVDLEKN